MQRIAHRIPDILTIYTLAASKTHAAFHPHFFVGATCIHEANYGLYKHIYKNLTRPHKTDILTLGHLDTIIRSWTHTINVKAKKSKEQRNLTSLPSSFGQTPPDALM
jgi:hypothetical protein